MLGQYRCTASFGLSYGLHTLNFVATDKDGATGPPSSNQIDVLPTASTVTLAEALDSPHLSNVISTVGGTAAWPFIGVMGETHNGEIGDLALSGLTGELQTSSVSATVTGPGWLTFWWKITGDEYDEFKFYLNGAQQGPFFEKGVWRQVGVNIPVGTVTLGWQYKDGYLGAGNGSGVVDDVVFTPQPVITLSVTSFPDGIVGQDYPATTVTQSGGAAPTRFSITSGSLPPGLILSEAGIVSGTPTLHGTFDFQITATDAHGFTGARVYQLVVVRPEQIFVDDFESRE
jgi:hypothetical protein